MDSGPELGPLHTCYGGAVSLWYAWCSCGTCNIRSESISDFWGDLFSPTELPCSALKGEFVPSLIVTCYAMFGMEGSWIWGWWESRGRGNFGWDVYM